MARLLYSGFVILEVSLVCVWQCWAKMAIPLTNHGNLMYTAPVSIGSAPQTFDLIMDTSSTNLWVADSICSQRACGSARFDCSASRSCNNTGQPFHYSYLGGPIDGHVKSDVVCFGYGNDSSYCTPPTQRFATTTRTIAGLSGVMGLSHGNLSKGDLGMPFYSVLDNPNCQQKMFSMYFTYVPANSSADNGGSELMLCGWNPALETGTTYYYLLDPNRRSGWIIPLQYTSYRGRKLVDSESYRHDAIVDTGASFLGFPEGVYHSLRKELGIGNMSNFSCTDADSFGNLTITIHGIDFDLPPYYWVYNAPEPNRCYIAISNRGERNYVIGLTFMHRYYMIFNYENNGVGITLAQGAR